MPRGTSVEDKVPDVCGFCDVKGHVRCGEQVNGFYCTRLRGHSGPHVACGGVSRHTLRLWETKDMVFMDIAEAVDHLAARRPKDCNCKPVKLADLYHRKIVWREASNG